MTESSSAIEDDEAASPDSRAAIQSNAQALMPALRQTANMQSLPETAHDLIEVMGLQATIDLVGLCGGTDLKIPAVVGGSARTWRELVEGIGEEAARKLVLSPFGGTPVYVPMCTAALRSERNRLIVEMMRGGEGIERTRRKFKLTRSAVYRIFRLGSAS